MFVCRKVPETAEQTGGLIPTGTSCAGAKSGTARAEKINLILGERTTGGGTDLKRHGPRAREQVIQDHQRGTDQEPGRQQRTPGDPLGGCFRRD